jgi:SAM-dependent methyltransferase
MDKYFKNNQDMWNDWAPLHAASQFYDVAGFRKGRCTLYPIELEEVGDVTGKSLLHFQYHFGLDTLSWARRGAKVTGIDFSDKAVDIARSLSKETEIKADFVNSNIYDLPKNLTGQFDVVYTSAEVLCWLPDLKGWADVIVQFLKPGGFFYILEGHPFLNMLYTDNLNAVVPEITKSYFYTPEPEEYQTDSSYTGDKTQIKHTGDEWMHSLGDIINSLISAGLKIEFLHEYPKIFFKAMPYMVQDKDGYWRIPGDKIPLIFTLKATKPG